MEATLASILSIYNTNSRINEQLNLEEILDYMPPSKEYPNKADMLSQMGELNLDLSKFFKELSPLDPEYINSISTELEQPNQHDKKRTLTIQRLTDWLNKQDADFKFEMIKTIKITKEMCGLARIDYEAEAKCCLAVIRRCPNLQKLNIDYWRHMDLFVTAEDAPELQELTLTDRWPAQDSVVDLSKLSGLDLTVLKINPLFQVLHADKIGDWFPGLTDVDIGAAFDFSGLKWLRSITLRTKTPVDINTERIRTLEYLREVNVHAVDPTTLYKLPNLTKLITTFAPMQTVPATVTDLGYYIPSLNDLTLYGVPDLKKLNSLTLIYPLQSHSEYSDATEVDIARADLTIETLKEKHEEVVKLCKGKPLRLIEFIFA